MSFWPCDKYQWGNNFPHKRKAVVCAFGVNIYHPKYNKNYKFGKMYKFVFLFITWSHLRKYIQLITRSVGFLIHTRGFDTGTIFKLP